MNQLCVPPAHKLMVAVPIMTLKSISVCPSVRRSPIHPIRPSVRPPIHPSISIYLSIYLSIYRSGTEMSWCQNNLVPNHPGNFFRLVPKRLGAETSRAESSRCRNHLVPKSLLSSTSRSPSMSSMEVKTYWKIEDRQLDIHMGGHYNDTGKIRVL